MRKSTFFILILAGAVLLCQLPASALPVVYDVRSLGADARSVVHLGWGWDADGFTRRGILLFEIEGSLSGDLVDGVLHIAPDQTLLARSAHPFAYGDSELRIGGGTLFGGDSEATGFLDYELRSIAWGATWSAGTFAFAPQEFGGPDALSATGFALWGNNWDDTDLDRGQFGIHHEPRARLGHRLGLDLTGVAQKGGSGGGASAVPEPGGAPLFLVGALVTATRARRSRSQTLHSEGERGDAT